MKDYIISYGKSMTIRYKQIYYSVDGNDDEVIVLLAAKSSPAPLTEMKALAHFLKEKYTVITVDYLGSGLSSNYNSDRTLENITTEIHSVIAELGYSSYSIVACAEAGLYSLYYANKYTDEVKAVIGINSYVAEQIDDIIWTQKMSDLDALKRDFCHSKIIHLLVYLSAIRHLKCSKDYKYSENDLHFYGNMAVYQLEDISLLDDYKCEQENYCELKGVKYPESVRVLFILSKLKDISGWYDIHKQQICNCCESNIVVITGKKNIHISKAKQIAAEIDIFLSNGDDIS